MNRKISRNEKRKYSNKETLYLVEVEKICALLVALNAKSWYSEDVNENPI